MKPLYVFVALTVFLTGGVLFQGYKKHLAYKARHSDTCAKALEDRWLFCSVGSTRCRETLLARMCEL